VVYMPQHFEETDTAALHRLIGGFPLGTLVTLGSEGLAANHIPFVLDARTGVRPVAWPRGSQQRRLA
jgi:transcriptional regulator